MESSNTDRAPIDDASRSLLGAFDQLDLTRLGKAELLAAAGGSAAAEAALARTIETGCIREYSGQYERTEAGRLEVASPSDLTFLGRSDCHICKLALRGIEPLAARFDLRLRIIYIDSDSALLARYDLHVPVVFLGSRELAREKIDPRQIQVELSRASKRK